MVERGDAGAVGGLPSAGGRPAERTPDERLADHAEIDRVADELLPALVAKLGASGLGELDVREGRWRVRLRMPGDGRSPRRSSASPAPLRNPARHDAPAAAGSAAPLGAGAGVGHGLDATAPAEPRAGGPPAPAAPAAPAADAPAPAATRAVAVSPAVGFFRPRADLAVGSRVRAGDRLAGVDVLGVSHEVAAPTSGLLGATLVGDGDPVEYGQPVVEIELLDERPGAG